jgi:DNA-binding CsgD family transcriptional regulator
MGRRQTKIRSYTERQNQLITLIATGHSNQEMALHLGINIRTVQFHLAGIRKDIGCGNNDYELALWAYLVMDRTLLRGHPYPENRAVRRTVYPEALPNTAWCAQCRGYLDRSLFNLNRSRPSKLDSICKMHRAIAKRKWLERLKRDPIRWAHLKQQQQMFYMTRKHYEGSRKYEHSHAQPYAQPYDGASTHLQQRASVPARRSTTREQGMDSTRHIRSA